MKHVLVVLLSLFFLGNSCKKRESAPVEIKKEGMEKEIKKSPKVLRHVVLFNFVDTASMETIGDIERAFAALPGKIPEIYDFEWGTNNSPEGLDKGLSHCFLVTFRSEKDRDIYLPHPAHQEFVSFIGPYVEDVTVVDYWTQ